VVVSGEQVQQYVNGAWLDITPTYRGQRGPAGTTDHTQLTNRDADDQHPLYQK
jgi:hypothetical protein